MGELDWTGRIIKQGHSSASRGRPRHLRHPQSGWLGTDWAGCGLDRRLILARIKLDWSKNGHDVKLP